VAEIVDGDLYVSPRPASRHALAASALGAELGPPFHRGRGGPGGWWIIHEPELHFTDDVLVPDLAGWRRDRMPEFPDTAAFTLAPADRPDLPFPPPGACRPWCPGEPGA
jgi:hypothetical protein